MTERKKAGADKPGQDEQVAAAQAVAVEKSTQQITCGLIMPIASNDGGTAEHWRQVRQVITSAISSLNFKVQMVSESEAVSVIHKNIIQNIFTNEIVICDVSSRNPNVMFELGMRLAFDKPVVIIKDRDTPFSFDIGSIQHIEYPHSLNYIEILSFQEELLKKVEFTMSEAEAAKNGGGRYSPFLSNYTITEVSEIRTHQVDKEEYVIEKLNELTDTVKRLERHVPNQMGQLKTRRLLALNDWSSNSSFSKNIKSGIANEIVEEILLKLNEPENKCHIDTINEIDGFCKEYLDTQHPRMPEKMQQEVIKTVKLICANWGV